jgi:O-antigen/teichoic acid export membrane protein
MNKLKALTSIGLADIIGTGISAFFWFYLATLIEPSQYGEIHYFIGIATIASVISLFGTQNTLVVYTAKNVKIQATFYFISLVVGAISSLAIIIIFYRIDAAVVLLGYVINTLAIGDLLGKKSYNSYAKYILTQKVLTLVLGLGFYFIFGVDGILYALSLSYVAFVIQIYKGFRSLNINFSLLKPRIGFIVNNYAIGVVAGFGGQIDKIIIAPLLGFAILGNYSLALQVISVLTIFSTIIFKYLLSHDASGNQNKKIRRYTVYSSISASFFGMLVLPFVIPYFFPKFIEAVQPIQIMSLGIIPYTINMLYTSKFLGLEKSKFVFIGTMISLVTLTTGTIFLGIHFGTTGIAVSYLLSATFSTIFLTSVDKIIK